MAPGTKRIAAGGLALAVVAWFAIDAWLPEPAALAPPPRDGEGLTAIPEVATRAPARRPAAPPGAIEPGADPAPLAAVLVGCFRGELADGATVVERYRLAGPALIAGELTDTGADGGVRFHETMRIAFEAGTWRYHPAPFGEPAPVSFALTAQGGGRLRFENPAHDYPRLIEYRREGDRLVTHVAGVEGGEARQEDYATRAVPCG